MFPFGQKGTTIDTQHGSVDIYCDQRENFYSPVFNIISLSHDYNNFILYHELGHHRDKQYLVTTEIGFYGLSALSCFMFKFRYLLPIYATYHLTARQLEIRADIYACEKATPKEMLEGIEALEEAKKIKSVMLNNNDCSVLEKLKNYFFVLTDIHPSEEYRINIINKYYEQKVSSSNKI
jgi:Zn-dependent protease with chaperone function